MGFQQATAWQIFSWQDVTAVVRRLAADEAEFARKLWRKILAEAASLPFLEEVLTAHYCAFDRRTPFYVKVILAAAIVYFVVPDDLVPDSLSLIGLADDAAVFGLAFKVVSSHIKPEHREAARAMLARLREQPA
jgi:uncharacterized membrane protein YkvA (DUF1232 family)